MINGLCLIIKTQDRTTHLEHFLWAENYYFELLGVQIDKSCKDVPRLRFVSYDPDLFVATNAKIAGKKKETKAVKAANAKPVLPLLSTDTQVGRLVAEIAGNGINIAEDRNDWRNLAFAFSSEFGEGGRISRKT